MKHHPFLIRQFAQHPVAANLLMALMILVGIFSLSQINIQFFPDFDVNQINVQVVWPGANADDVARSITRPIEQNLRQLEHLKKMESTSRFGVASITLEFQQHTNMNEAVNEVRDQVNRIRNLPNNAEKPIVKRIEPFETVAKLLIYGPNHLNTLRPLAYQIEQELLDAGIGQIEITGLPELQMAIAIPNYHLIELGLSFDQIASMIAQQSTDVPAGTIGRHQFSQQLRAKQQKRTIQEFRDIPIVGTKPTDLIHLKDIANIQIKPQQQQPLVFYHQQPAVLLTLQRTEQANALANANLLNRWLKNFRSQINSSLKITTYDQRWEHIKERIYLLVKNGISGLALIILLLFLMLQARLAWWVIIGIPTSFMAALGVLYLAGGSINMISLFGMIMSLGIIVDDTIVVSEETATQFQHGKTALASVSASVQKMLPPVMTSSLTTICAFIPLLMIGDIMGQILFDIPFVVICIIIASLIEAFLVLPGHLYHSLKKATSSRGNRLQQTVNHYFQYIRQRYFKRLVLIALKHSYTTLLAAVALLLFAFWLVYSGILPFNFFPTPEGTKIYANVRFVPGTPPKQVRHFVKQMAKQAHATDQQLSSQHLMMTLVRYQNQTAEIGDGQPSFGEQYGGIDVELISPEQRSITNQQFITHWRQQLKLLPTGVANLTISTPQVGPPGKPIDIALSNHDLTRLKQAAMALKQKLATFNGVSNIQDNLPFGQTQLVFKLNEKGESLGLTTRQVSRQVRAAFSGALAQIFNTADDEIEVRVQLPARQRHQLNTINHLPIITPAGKAIPFEAIASIKSKQGFDVIRHTNTKPTIHITADINYQLNSANHILNQLDQQFLPQLQTRYNLNYHFAGRAEDQAETLQDMLYGLLLGMALIYIILAWVFGSYGWPLIIMLTIPLGLTGAILGHWLLDINLTILSLFGLFGLSGIIVNNSIILLSSYKQKRYRINNIIRATISASYERFRAVLLTSLTTIAGLTPLIFEQSLQAQFLIPMAVSIVFGLAYGTLLILIVVPVLLTLYERLFHKSHHS